MLIEENSLEKLKWTTFLNIFGQGLLVSWSRRKLIKLTHYKLPVWKIPAGICAKAADIVWAA